MLDSKACVHALVSSKSHFLFAVNNGQYTTTGSTPCSAYSVLLLWCGLTQRRDTSVGIVVSSRVVVSTIVALWDHGLQIRKTRVCIAGSLLCPGACSTEMTKGESERTRRCAWLLAGCVRRWMKTRLFFCRKLQRCCDADLQPNQLTISIACASDQPVQATARSTRASALYFPAITLRCPLLCLAEKLMPIKGSLRHTEMVMAYSRFAGPPC